MLHMHETETKHGRSFYCCMHRWITMYSVTRIKLLVREFRACLASGSEHTMFTWTNLNRFGNRFTNRVPFTRPISKRDFLFARVNRQAICKAEIEQYGSFWRQIVLCRPCTAQISKRHGTAHACAVYRRCYQLQGDGLAATGLY